MHATSVSEIDCVLNLRGKGEALVSLYRHLAPVTVSAILGGLPISTRVNIYPRVMVCMLTELRLGVEKQRHEVTTGDIAFVPASASICFFLSSAKSDRPLNPIGRVQKGLEVLGRASAGDILELRAAEKQGQDSQ